MKEALRDAARSLDRIGDRLERIAAYVAKHGTDTSALKAILGVAEDATVSAVAAHNALVKDATQNAAR